MYSLQGIPIKDKGDVETLRFGVQAITLRLVQYPVQESNPLLQFRRLSCFHHTHRAFK